MDATALFRTASIRAIEARHAATGTASLMERAGAAVAEAACAMIGADRRPILILAGPGNNGGDGLVAARRLKALGLTTVVVFAGEADRLPADARLACQAWQAAGGALATAMPDDRDFALAIDALFGIGLTRPIAGRMAELIDRCNALHCPKLAVDIPSGLCADTGRLLGQAIGVSRTLTFIAAKPGLFTLNGPDYCGEVIVDDLGLSLDAAEGRLIGRDLFRHRLRPRARNSHKGSFGAVGILGGAPGMAGAALLAGRAALKLGAGRVYLGMLERLAVDPRQPELMLRTADEVPSLATALAVGPGLGASPEAVAVLRQAIASPLPLVIDADALNLLAAHPVLWTKVSRRDTPTLLTPHPAEAARLLHATTESVQADRLVAARTLAERSRAWVVLKGCGSIVARPDGAWFVNNTGNPGLAAAGSGDVLTGIAAALLAQGWPTGEALLAAVHLHGAAADLRVAQGCGPVGLTAGEIIDAARTLFNHWIADA